MSKETHRIPKVSQTALRLLVEKHQQAVTALANQTVEALGLDGNDWHVDFDAGTVSRDVSDQPKANDPA